MSILNINSRNKWLVSKRKIYYNILKLMGLCSACFLFEACYGSPQNETPPDYKMNIKGIVKSADSLKPLRDIKIAISNSGNSGNVNTSTSANGLYTYNTVINDTKLNWTVKASDVDDSLNGSFIEKETTFVITGNEFNNSEANIDLLLKRH
jgi:hypothetical protein